MTLPADNKLRAFLDAQSDVFLNARILLYARQGAEGDILLPGIAHFYFFDGRFSPDVARKRVATKLPDYFLKRSLSLAHRPHILRQFRVELHNKIDGINSRERAIQRRCALLTIQ